MALDSVAPEGGFDYSGIPADVRAELEGHARSIKFHVANALPELVAAGKVLAEAKKKVHAYKQTGWGRWLRGEVGMSRANAFKIMAIARHFESFQHETIYIQQETAYRLTTVPKAAEAVKAMVANGDEVTETVARRVYDEHAPKKVQQGSTHTPVPDTDSPLTAVQPERGAHGAFRTKENHEQRAYETVLADVYAWRAAGYLNLDPASVRASADGTDWAKEADRINDVIAWLQAFTRG